MDEEVWERENMPFERIPDDYGLICMSQQQLRMNLSALYESNLEKGGKARRPV